MAVQIVIINKDKTRTTYASVDAMPAGEIKTEIETILSYSTSCHLTKICKIIQ